MVVHALKIQVEFRYGLDPQAPVQEREELSLKEIEFLERDTSNVSHEMVAIEDIVVEFRGQKHRS